MLRTSAVFSTTLLIALASAIAVGAQSVPTSYPAANATRVAIPKPPLPTLGPAGFQFVDPALGSRLLRVTDANTRPGFPGRSFVSGSAAHQLDWNATSDKFWVRGIDGTYIPYTFDAATMMVARIHPTPGVGEGGLTILSQLEPQFSFVSPNLLFGTRQSAGTSHPVIRQYDFTSDTYTDILDLGTITTIANNTYGRALAGSAAAPEKLSMLFGGAQQDLDYKVVVFQVGPPVTNVVVLDSLASTITRGGVTTSTNIGLGITLHHAWIDMSGRYVTLYPTNGSFPGVLPYFIWDTTTDMITKVTRFPGGHDALGYGMVVNQDCCTTTGYDGAQWQLRSLATPTTTSDLVNPGSPQEVFIADHTSWNNAQTGTLVPVLSTLYRYDASSSVPWRAWDDEIVAIQTNAAPAAATVWRFAQHRSDIAYDGRTNTTDIYFWYLPRAEISPDGKWAMFTSNWEKTLGATVGSDIEPGGQFRNDVFIVALTPSVAVAPTVTVSPSTVNTRGTLTVSVANGPGNALDWVALSATGSSATSSVTWKYIGGGTSATVQLVVPATAPAGTYEVRFLANDGFVRLATSSPITVQAPIPTVTASPSPVNAGGTLTVSVANGPGNALDWVALSASGSSATSSVTWKYIGGGTSATVQLVVPATTAAGTYEVRFLANDGFVRLATSSPITVQAAAPAPAATVTASPSPVNAGGTLTVSVANGPGNALDWVALSASGSSATSSVAWKYIGGGTSATVRLVVPVAAPAGTYEVRFLANDGFVRLATSSPITVQAAAPAPAATVTASPSPVNRGGMLTVSVANGPGNALDWVALAATGSSATSSVVWKYIGGGTSATVQLVVPATAPAGTYEVRFLANDGFVRLATSSPITVQ